MIFIWKAFIQFVLRQFDAGIDKASSNQDNLHVVRNKINYF
jgi:hypothetical protein